MGENAAKIGKKLEGFGENLISDFGWLELTRDREIKCQRPAHKKKTHGIDLLCKFNNPYLNGNQGIIIECKNFKRPYPDNRNRTPQAEHYHSDQS